MEEAMKEVTRYKCDFCRKLAARPETIKRHESVCLKNPSITEFAEMLITLGYKDITERVRPKN